MTEMIFNPAGPGRLSWDNVSESFWINLQLTFDDYQEASRTDIDRMAVFVLESEVFYEGASCDQQLVIGSLGAIALRRMYHYYRLRSIQYDGFLYQFEEMIRQIEAFFREQQIREVQLTPLVPPEW